MEAINTSFFDCDIQKTIKKKALNTSVEYIFVEYTTLAQIKDWLEKNGRSLHYVAHWFVGYYFEACSLIFW